MVSPRPQTFVPGSYWPPWAVQESFEVAAWKHALQSGFEPTIKTGKQSIVLTCKSPLCPFTVKLLKGDDSAGTSEVELKHSHAMFSFSELAKSTPEAKKVHKKCSSALYDAADALQKKAIAEVKRYRIQADNEAMSTYALPGKTTELSPTTGQEGIFWEVADALGQQRARELEDAMRKERQLTDFYPGMSTFDGRSSPFDTPISERFPPSSSGPSLKASGKAISTSLRQEEEWKEKQQGEAASPKKKSKKRLLPAVNPECSERTNVTAPTTTSKVRSNVSAASASKSNTPSSSVKKKTLIDFSGVSPFAKSTPTKRVKKEEQNASSATEQQLAIGTSKISASPGLFDGSAFFDSLFSPPPVSRETAPSPTLLVKKEARADVASRNHAKSADTSSAAASPALASSSGTADAVASPAHNMPLLAEGSTSADLGAFVSPSSSSETEAISTSIFASESNAHDDLKAYLNNLPNSSQFSFCDRYHDKLVDAQIETGQQLRVVAQNIPEELKATLSLGGKDLVYAIFERALAAQREEEIVGRV